MVWQCCYSVKECEKGHNSAVKYLLLILLAGCASTHIEPVADRITAVIDFYDDAEQVAEACNISGAKGCAVWTESKSFCYVRVIKTQQCLDHELDHCIHGDFHDRDTATACQVRAGDN